jgi:hypothetical protein
MNRDNAERRKQQLITMGKAKGYLTYDEVNDHMPDDVVSSDQIDDWLSSLGDEGIEVVDSAASVKVRSTTAPKVPELIEDDEKKEEEEEEEFDGGYSKTNDPVRMYLRKMGSVSLLTREGEVEIAKRIEEGERRVLQVVLNSSIAVEEILDLASGSRSKRSASRMSSVISTKRMPTSTRNGTPSGSSRSSTRCAGFSAKTKRSSKSWRHRPRLREPPQRRQRPCAATEQGRRSQAQEAPRQD